MSTTIQETTNRLRELDRYAIPAPWEAWGCGEDEQTSIEHPMGDVLERGERGYGHMREDTTWLREADADLITETRNALPALLTELDRLQKSERALKDRFARIFNTWRSRRPELIRKNRAEAWEEGYTEGLLSGMRLERTGVELPHSNPYEK